jgi:nicotinate phosphoribosyltransferase
MNDSVFFTDLYQLTMAQGYYFSKLHEQQAQFEYFIRKTPFEGGYVVFAGLKTLLDQLTDYSFAPAQLDYLAQLGFKGEFLDYLSTWTFAGNLYSLQEGEIAFPHEPIVVATGTLIETQLIETLLLNTLNFYSLIATKAARMKFAAGHKQLIELGLRRAQGNGGLQASEAAIIGGVSASSNVLAGFKQQVPVVGTMAHAFVQTFDDEYQAFEAYSHIYPDQCTLLVDTYDTLKSGVPNAIRIAHELAKKGHTLKAIRLDSGDLAMLSHAARKMLDEAGLQHVKIIATNELDEYLIQSLQDQGAAIDVFGVGTRLVTGGNQGALGGVYKLVALNEQPRIKISENIAKINLPGKKVVKRWFDQEGYMRADTLSLINESQITLFSDPTFAETTYSVAGLEGAAIHHWAMQNGQRTAPASTLAEIADYASSRLALLPAPHKRFQHPQLYPVGISVELRKLRADLIQQKRA